MRCFSTYSQRLADPGGGSVFAVSGRHRVAGQGGAARTLGRVQVGGVILALIGTALIAFG